MIFSTSKSSDLTFSLNFLADFSLSSLDLVYSVLLVADFLTGEFLEVEKGSIEMRDMFEMDLLVW